MRFRIHVHASQAVKKEEEDNMLRSGNMSDDDR